MSTTTSPAATATVAAGRTASAVQRLASLDVFRGLTIAGMILVNHPGNHTAIYWPLEHAEWNGWTPTDLIFPFFLFIVGVSLVFPSPRGSAVAKVPRHCIGTSWYVGW